MKIVVFILFVLPLLMAVSSQSQELELGSGQAPVGVLSMGEQSSYVMVVGKKERLLKVFEWNGSTPRLVTQAPSDIGKNQGDKQKLNDNRTPTGIYFLLERLSQPAIPFDLYGELAFTTDYPNVFDRRQRKTGYGIWLHAVPDSIPLTRGSRGCVVVRNDIVKKLSKFVQLRETPLVIYDEIEMVDVTEFQKRRSQILAQFEKWRSAWAGKDLNTYLSYYHDTFHNGAMDLQAWKNHKTRLKEIYEEVAVAFSEPLILTNRDQIVIRALQHYKSDRYEDFGVKTLHAYTDSELGFKIVREDWTPASPELLERISSRPMAEITRAQAATKKASVQN